MAADAFRDVSDAVPGLRALLATESSEGRAGAAHGLLMAGRPAAAMAVPDLFAAMEREPEADVRTIMARALCFLIGREAVADGIGPLVRVLGDPHPPVRAWVAEILAGAGPEGGLRDRRPGRLPRFGRPPPAGERRAGLEQHRLSVPDRRDEPEAAVRPSR